VPRLLAPEEEEEEEEEVVQAAVGAFAQARGAKQKTMEVLLEAEPMGVGTEEAESWCCCWVARPEVVGAARAESADVVVFAHVEQHLLMQRRLRVGCATVRPGGWSVGWCFRARGHC